MNGENPSSKTEREKEERQRKMGSKQFVELGLISVTWGEGSVYIYVEATNKEKLSRKIFIRENQGNK